jgi:hypothetical protein
MVADRLVTISVRPAPTTAIATGVAGTVQIG